MTRRNIPTNIPRIQGDYTQNKMQDNTANAIRQLWELIKPWEPILRGQYLIPTKELDGYGYSDEHPEYVEFGALDSLTIPHTLKRKPIGFIVVDCVSGGARLHRQDNDNEDLASITLNNAESTTVIAKIWIY